MKKKFFSLKTRGTEKSAIAIFMSKARAAGIEVKRFSITPVHPITPNQESALFKVVAIEAYASLQS